MSAGKFFSFLGEVDKGEVYNFILRFIAVVILSTQENIFGLLGILLVISLYFGRILMNVIDEKAFEEKVKIIIEKERNKKKRRK